MKINYFEQSSLCHVIRYKHKCSWNEIEIELTNGKRSDGRWMKQCGCQLYNKHQTNHQRLFWCIFPFQNTSWHCFVCCFWPLPPPSSSTLLFLYPKYTMHSYMYIENVDAQCRGNVSLFNGSLSSIYILYQIQRNRERCTKKRRQSGDKSTAYGFLSMDLIITTTTVQLNFRSVPIVMHVWELWNPLK